MPLNGLKAFYLLFRVHLLLFPMTDIFLIKLQNRTIEIENCKLRSYKGNYSDFLIKRKQSRKRLKISMNRILKEIERLREL